jgi:hypothetical protein
MNPAVPLNDCETRGGRFFLPSPSLTRECSFSLPARRNDRPFTRPR